MNQDLKISELPLSDSLDGSELLVYAKGGANSAVSTKTLQTYVQNGVVKKIEGKGLSTNDYTNTDKNKLDAIEDGAQKNTVTSVSGKKGEVTLTKEDVGLENVNNTSDVDKPISTAVQNALNGKVDNDKYTNGQQAQDERLSQLENLVTGGSANPELFRKAKNIAIGAWNHDDLNPDAIDFYGDKAVAGCWDFVLVDCEAAANSDGTQPVIGKLKHNNLLRFDDGRFAPTVGITEAMRAECDVELYLDSAHTQKYCDAGAFNAEAFYSEHGMAKLYNADGTEVRVLRPWETTETKYSVFLATDRTLYPIDRLVGNSGTEWSGVMEIPLKWDGLDIEKFALAPTGITPTAFCTVENKARCFFFAYEADHAYCRSSEGKNKAVTMFSNSRTYPRCIDVSQSSAGTKSRANNTDPLASYPFAEGGALARNVYNLCLEAKYGSKNLNDANKWGTGISSDNACNSEATWLANGGVRYKLTGADTYTYQPFYLEPTNLFIKTDGSSKTYWNDWLNQEYPKEQCMESQMAMSFANETGVAEGERFDFYGGTYWYYDVPQADRTYMSARVYKIMTQNGCAGAYGTDGNPVTFDVEVVLRMSLYDGATLSGDIFSYDNGGCYLIGKYSGSITNNTIRAYIEPDQRRWGPVQTVLSSEADYHWPFESTYIPLDEYVATGNNWMRKRQSWGTGKLAAGGNLTSGECAYNYDHCYWASDNANIGKLYLVGVRSRLIANNTFCSRRSVYCYYVHGFPNRNTCASAQVLLPTGWRSRGATQGKA